MATVVAQGYDQDIHRQLATAMDTTGMLSGYLSEVLPPQSFTQSLDPSYMVKAEQLDEVTGDMHVVSQDHYMTMSTMAVHPSDPLSVDLQSSMSPTYPPEIVPGATYSHLAPSSSDSPHALSTPSPPVVTSPSLVSVLAPTSSTFNTSSLDAALVPNGPLTSPTRSVNSMSPVSAPSPFGSLSSQSPPAPPPDTEEVVLDQEVPLVLQKGTVNQMLDMMVQDLIAAKEAVNTGEGDIRELQSRIAAISRMAANISLSEQNPPEPLPGSMDAMTGIADFNTYSGHPAPPLDPSPPLLDVNQPILEMAPAGIAPPPLTSMPLEISLPAPMSDQSRKRNASAMQSPPISAVLKHEPSEEAPLLLPATDPLVVGSVPSMFPAMSAIPLSAQAPSRPGTRPPTPQSAFAAATFLPSISSYGVNTTSMVMGSSGLGTPMLSNPSFSSVRPGWPDQTGSVNRHHHSLSAGSIIHPIPPMHIAMPPGAPLMPTLASGPPTPSSLLPPQLTRTSRSGSLSNMGNGFEPFNFDPMYGFTVPDSDMDLGPPLKKATLGSRNSRSSTVATNWYFGDASSPSNTSEEPATAPVTARNTPSDDEDDDSSSDSEFDHGTNGKANGHSSSSDTPPGPTSSTASDIPAEYRSEVDRIFFEYLDRLCSDLDARDSKGDQIHQPLMMKKMQRLDESPDWRGFKFRIQAFTSAFLEELAKQGYPEDKIPMKKVRNYLWHQPHIQRFNEDGKKAKSKGNHIWNIEARRRPESKSWEFRPFKRKLAGSAAPIAYTGLKWSWTPRVWDPQSSFSNVPVKYSSPNLPPWLSWKDDALCGTPPPDAESCTVMVTAEYTVDGVKGVLTRNLPINIAPVSSVQAYPRSRRASVSETPPRRSSSDSALSQAPQRSKNRGNVAPVPIPGETPSNRVIRVLQNVAQRVDEETQLSQFASPPMLQAPMREMAKSKQVLQQTVNAMDQEMTGHAHFETKRLAIAAQQVVIQAAANVIADRNVSIGRAPVVANKSTAVQRVSVNELSDATHDAIVQAVKHNGPASSEVDIIVTAASILKAQAPVGEPHPPSTTITRPPTHPPSFIQNLASLPEHA